MLWLSMFLIACGSAAFVCFYADQIGRALLVIDMPDVAGGRKRHDRPTPLVGGIAVLAALGLSGALYAAFGSFAATQSSHLVIIAGLTAAFSAIGFIDDRHGLSPRIRLIMLLLIVGGALLNAPELMVRFLQFSFLPSAYFLGAWSMIFTLLCLIGLVNAVNMADGKNGLVISMALIWSFVLIIYGAPILQPLLIAVAGALGVALFFNMRGLLFLGDAGSFGLAGFFGLTTIYSFNHRFIDLPSEVVLAMFLMPVLDCLRLMVSRVLQGRSPFSAGRDHLHHYIAMLYGWERGLAIYLSMVALPIVGCIAAPQAGPAVLALAVLAYAAVLFLANPNRAIAKAPAA